MTWVFNNNSTYMVDILSKNASGAIALNNFFRNIAGSLGSMLISPVLNRLGYERAFLILGILSLAGSCLPFLVYKYGENWRKQFAV